MGAIDQFSNSLMPSELWSIVIGTMLGRGISRETYSVRQNDDLVLKFEVVERYYQNTLEWEIWERVSYTKHAKWFAPCVDISACGRILLMKRTLPAEPSSLPKQVPAFFTDTKAENWGMYKGRPVCHDYGVNLLMEKGMTGRMRKPSWY